MINIDLKRIEIIPLATVSSGEGGSANADLSNYYTKGEVNTKLQTYSKTSHTHTEYLTEDALNENYYNKGEVNNLIDGLSTGDGEVNLTNYYTKDEVNNLIPKDYLTEIPSEFITETELNKSLSGYAKLTDIPTDYIKSIPSEYITETELNAKGYLTQHQSLSNYYTKSEVDSKIPIDYITEDELNDMNFATKSELPSEYDDTSIVNRITALETELTGVSEQITELNNMVV